MYFLAETLICSVTGEWWCLHGGLCNKDCMYLIVFLKSWNTSGPKVSGKRLWTRIKILHQRIEEWMYKQWCVYTVEYYTAMTMTYLHYMQHHVDRMKPDTKAYLLEGSRPCYFSLFPAGKEFAYNTWIWSLGQEDPLEEEMVTYSSILAWEIPWTEEPGRLQSMGVGKSQTSLSAHTTHTHTHTIQTQDIQSGRISFSKYRPGPWLPLRP